MKKVEIKVIDNQWEPQSILNSVYSSSFILASTPFLVTPFLLYTSQRFLVSVSLSFFFLS